MQKERDRSFWKESAAVFEENCFLYKQHGPVPLNICTVCYVNTTYSDLSKHAAAQL